jgi:hypothetical protein
MWGALGGWNSSELVPYPDWGLSGTGFASLVPLAAGVLMIVGSQQLKALRSYPWSLAGAIAALMPADDLWLIYAGIGAWALAMMHLPDVREAFEPGRHPVTDDPSWNDPDLRFAASFYSIPWHTRFLNSRIHKEPDYFG